MQFQNGGKDQEEGVDPHSKYDQEVLVWREDHFASLGIANAQASQHICWILISSEAKLLSYLLNATKPRAIHAANAFMFLKAANPLQVQSSPLGQPMLRYWQCNIISALWRYHLYRDTVHGQVRHAVEEVSKSKVDDEDGCVLERFPLEAKNLISLSPGYGEEGKEVPETSYAGHQDTTGQRDTTDGRDQQQNLQYSCYKGEILAEGVRVRGQGGWLGLITPQPRHGVEWDRTLLHGVW